ncbi:hypothetical protein [Bradyrhizobium sp. ARR65]|uniref:hypothetical protein n=1 Tax=Bradyrhizobium sp. ARR65 TaxID=1040989 RepID=UPI0004657F02|nr:hypothetical protein [Bradyrhizobium sp. ARR65]
MKRAVVSVSAAFAAVGGIALAQGLDDPMARLRACSLMEGADRLECLDSLSRAIAPRAAPTPKEDRWIISQTMSPVDFTPIATATIPSREVPGGSAMQLSIRCRGGRTELAVAGPAVSGRGDDYAVFYRINGGPPAQIAAAVPAFGAGVSLKVDAVAMIQSLPRDGEFAVHLSPRVGAAQDGIFPLFGLETVRAKIAAPCKWPHAIAKPNN